MSYEKPIHRVAIVGTGVIGASWAAQYLARGFDVVGTDPAPNAEANLRKYVDEAWGQLEAIGLSPARHRNRLTFTTNMQEALSRADFVQENGPERPDFKMKLFADMDEATPVDSIIASSSSGITPSVMQSKCKHPERVVVGHPFNPPHIIPLVEVVGGSQDVARRGPAGDEVLCGDRQETDLSAQGVPRACREPTAGRALPRSDVSDPARRPERRRCRRCRELGAGTALGSRGAELAVAFGRRRQGGIKHFMDHLMDPLVGMFKTLATPKSRRT